MVLRRARSRSAAGIAAAALGGGLVVAVSVLLASPAWSITPPTDPDPAPGAAFAITSAVPSVITTGSFLVSGVSDPGGSDVTVEAVGAGNDTCVTNVTAEGNWACALDLTEQDTVTIQAYREGGLFLEDYDERTAVTVFAPAFVAGSALTWGAADYQQISGTRYSFNEIHVLVDGVEGPCFIDFPSGSPTTWSCTMTPALADGTYTVTAYQTSLAFMPPASGATTAMTLTVDTTAPQMASVNYPIAATAFAPEFGPELWQTTDRNPDFDGTAEPYAAVTVRYAAGGYDPYWDQTYPVWCVTVADQFGNWWCPAPLWLNPGDIYSFSAEQTDTAGNSTATIFQQFSLELVDGPVTPAISTPATGLTTSNPTVTLTGTGVYGDSILIYQDGEYLVCSTYVDQFGEWTCTTDPLPLGTHSLQAQAESDESYSGTDEITVTIVSPPPPAPPAPPAKPSAVTPPSPLAWTYELTDPDGNPLPGSSFAPGSSFIITANGLPPGSTANAELHSDPIALGSAVVTPAGTLTLPVTIPANVPPGNHELVVVLTPPSGVDSPSTRAVTVGVAASDEPTAAPSAAASPGADGEAGEEAPAGAVDTVRGSGGIDLSEPSSIGTTLQSVGDVVVTPVTAAVAASAAVAFILLVALPAELLQSTVAANYARAFGWLAPLRRRMRAWRGHLPAFLTSGRGGGAISVALTALLLGFSDPGFGFNGTSLRLWFAIFASLYLVNVAVIGVVRLVARRRYGVASSIEPMPASLLIVLASVLISRAAGIEPGFLFGLVVGIAFGRELLVYEEGKLAALGGALMIAVGLAAWLVYSALPDGDGGGFVVNLLRDTLAATTLEALGTILVALLPVAYLDGQGLFRWSKWRWVVLYLLGVLAFLFVVVPMSDTWGEMKAPYLGWMTLFLGFAVVAVGIWAVFRFSPVREDAHAGRE